MTLASSLVSPRGVSASRATPASCSTVSADVISDLSLRRVTLVRVGVGVGVAVRLGVGVGVELAARHLAMADARQGLRRRHRKEREPLTGDRVWRAASRAGRHASAAERHCRVIGGQRLRHAHADARHAIRRPRAIRTRAAQRAPRTPCAVHACCRAAPRAVALAAPPRRWWRLGPPRCWGGRSGLRLRGDPARCFPEQTAQETFVVVAAAAASPDAATRWHWRHKLVVVL
jgi:hypothetical protein